MKQNEQINKETQDPIVSEKIELFIQQNENVTLPAIVFEYLSKDNTDFEENDLRNFYEQFGEIQDFQLNGKISVVLFKLFFAANTCREFLQNEHNFKDNMKKDFMVRWFNLDNDSDLIPEEMRGKYEQISQKNSINLKQNLSIQLNYINNNLMINPMMNNINLQNGNYNINNQYIQPNMNNVNMNNINNLQQNIHSMPNFGGIQNIFLSPQMNLPLFMNQNLAGMNNIMGMQMNNHQYNQNQKTFNQNI